MYDINKTVSIIKETAKERGVSISTMLTDIGINKNTLSSMSRRGSWVSSDTLARIADYLGVSVDYLLCREYNENSTPNYNVRSAIINRVNSLPDSQLDRLLGYLEALAEE
jgi:transcriptional regulator with XRE-family HTH domain